LDSREERTPRDAEFARSRGSEFADLLLTRDISTADWRHEGVLPAARFLLQQFLDEVTEYVRQGESKERRESKERPPLDTETTDRFVKDVDDALRVVSFSRLTRWPGPPVLLRPGDPLEGLTLFDLFSARARQSVFRGIGFPEPPALSDENWPRFREILPFTKAIAWMDERTAMRGVLRLFADSLRSAVHWFRISGPVLNPFEVRTRNDAHGYQLDWYYPYRYSPKVFGNGAKSSPVSGHLATDHYCFQGWINGTVTHDNGSYFAGPTSATARLRDF
jgi:hypothetical protein